METLYDILEVSRKASKEIIEKAYKTLAKKYHPDVQSVENKSNAEEMMKKINHAYDVLSDDEKRREYDRGLEEQEAQKEQKKVAKQIRREASEEYRKQYEAYFRDLGFRIKHRWTFKDFLAIFLVIIILIFIIYILWLIPATHEVLAEIYEENFFIKLIVDIFKGIFQGIIKFFKNILQI